MADILFVAHHLPLPVPRRPALTNDNDMRQSNDTMCEDNLLLVNTVQKYPCLYNFNIPEYMKKEETDAAWSEVASCIRQTVHECKEKWRNLRYSFLRSLKPHPDGSAKKRYYLHKEMEFLLPFMKTRYDGVIVPQYDDDSDDETNIGEEDTITVEESTNNLDFTTFEFQTTEPLPKRRKTSHKLTKDYGNTECPRKMFLLGLLPEISGMSEIQMKVFRRKVFALIDNITENDAPNTDDHNVYNKNRSRENAKKSDNSNERELITTIKAEPL